MYTNLHHFIELAALDFQRNQFWLIEAIKLFDLRLFSFNYDFSPRNLFNIMQFCSSNNNKYRAHIRISFYKTKNKIFFNVIPFWSPTIHYTYTKRIPLILYISFSLFLFFADFIFCLFCILRGISGMHCCRRERNHKEDFLVLQIVLPLIDWPHFGFPTFFHNRTLCTLFVLLVCKFILSMNKVFPVFLLSFFLPDCLSYIAHHNWWSAEWTNDDEEWKSECKSVTCQEWKEDSIFGGKFLTEIKSTNTKDVRTKQNCKFVMTKFSNEWKHVCNFVMNTVQWTDIII